MENIGPCLHPNPGWNEIRGNETSESWELHSAKNIGKHFLLELYDCDKVKLNDEAFVRTTINTSAKIAGATLLNLMTHRFEPHGVTGLALLAESHISIHTWPELRYAAIDVFTCGHHTLPYDACKLLRQEFLAERALVKFIQREIPSQLSNVVRKPLSS